MENKIHLLVSKAQYYQDMDNFKALEENNRKLYELCRKLDISIIEAQAIAWKVAINDH